MKAIELQAHYIFVLVAGAFILGFFIVVAGKFRAGSESRADFQISTALQTVFNSAAQTPGAALNVTFPRKLEYDCTKTCDCSFRTGQKKTGMKESFYAPAKFPTSKATVFSLSQGVPRAINYLYGTSNDYKYYIIHDDSALAKEVIRKIPEAVRMEEGQNRDGMKYSGEARSVFAYLFTSPNLPESFKGRDVIQVKIEPSQAAYLRKEGNGVARYQTNDVPSILAAIFSENERVLKCNTRKGFARLQQVAEVLALRTEKLQLETSGIGLDCEYGVGVEELRIIINNAEKLKNADIDMAVLSAAQKDLVSINDALTNQGCPQII